MFALCQKPSIKDPCLYDIRTIFTNGFTLRRYLFHMKTPTEFNMTKNCVYSIPFNCGKVYKGKTCRPLKVRPEEHRKVVARDEIENSGEVDHIWNEKRNHLPLWDESKIDREHWRIRDLKESVHMLDYSDLFSRSIIEMNTIIENVKYKKRFFKIVIWAQVKKKKTCIIVIVVIK